MPRTSIRRSSRHRIAPSPWLAIPDEYFWYRRDGSLRARQTDRDRQLESHGPELGQSTRIAQGYLAFNRFSRMLRKIRSYVSWSPPAEIYLDSDREADAARRAVAGWNRRLTGWLLRFSFGFLLRAHFRRGGHLYRRRLAMSRKAREELKRCGLPLPDQVGRLVGATEKSYELVGG